MNIRRTCVFLLLPLLFPLFGYASDAVMEIAPSVGTYRVYDDVTLAVVVSSDGQEVSALEGRLSYNPKELTVTHVIKGASPISSWTQEPLVDGELGEIIFGGALATSTKMKSIPVLTLRVRPERAGEVWLRFDGGAAIISADGLGSNILTSFKSGKYRILPEELSDESIAPTPPSPTTKENTTPSSVVDTERKGEVLGAVATPLDRTPPTNFFLTEVTPRLPSDPDIVVHVSATDTESGVAYFTFSVDGAEHERFVDRGTHHFVYRAATEGVHTLVGIAYDHAGNTTTAKLLSTVSASSSLVAQGVGDESAMLAASAGGGLLHRHPFLPVMIVLLLLIVFFAVRIFRDARDMEEQASISSGVESDLSGQIVLSPRQKN